MSRNWSIAILLAAAGAALAGCLPAESVTSGSPPAIPVDTNSLPTISGQAPAQATPGTLYVFQPSATDPDGDVLTFSATGLPAWATINSQNGRVTGMPSTSHAGTTASIVISVSDGTASASMQAFTITVASAPTQPGDPTATGMATLNWGAPVQYTDGSALSPGELAGYMVYHGSSASNLQRVAMVEGATATSFVLNQLAAGRHYFAVGAITVTGVEGALSEVKFKDIL